MQIVWIDQQLIEQHFDERILRKKEESIKDSEKRCSKIDSTQKFLEIQ